jgi:hypothetical protein
VVCNIGLAIDATPEAAGVPAELFACAWNVLFSTDERRFGGTDDRVRFERDLIALPPHTAVVLASTRPSARGRLWSRVRSAGGRLRATRRETAALF